MVDRCFRHVRVVQLPSLQQSVMYVLLEQQDTVAIFCSELDVLKRGCFFECQAPHTAMANTDVEACPVGAISVASSLVGIVRGLVVILRMSTS